ncbi:MAG: hypothetical protein L6R43_19495 [Planctomycetes bacterium]|nr:hypothetical protein [Planctomycetota bacterium]
MAVLSAVLAAGLAGGLATGGVLHLFQWFVRPLGPYSYLPVDERFPITVGLVLLVFPAALLGAWCGEALLARAGFPPRTFHRRAVPAWRRLLFGVLAFLAGVLVALAGFFVFAGTWPPQDRRPTLPLLLAVPALALLATRAVERLAAPPPGEAPPAGGGGAPP